MPSVTSVLNAITERQQNKADRTDMRVMHDMLMWQKNCLTAIAVRLLKEEMEAEQLRDVVVADDFYRQAYEEIVMSARVALKVCDDMWVERSDEPATS